MTDQIPPSTPGNAPPGRRILEGPSAASFAGLGLQFVVSLLLFLFIGQWLDRKLGTAPWLLMLGVFVGAGASFYSIYRRLTAAQKKRDAAKQGGGPGR